MAKQTVSDLLARIPQMDWAGRIEGRGNAGETADSFFHPSGPSRPGNLIQRNSLILRPELARGGGRPPFHPGNPGLDTIERIRPLIAGEATAAEANRQISPAVYWAMEDTGTKLDFPKSWLQDIFRNRRYAIPSTRSTVLQSRIF